MIKINLVNTWVHTAGFYFLTHTVRMITMKRGTRGKVEIETVISLLN